MQVVKGFNVLASLDPHGKPGQSIIFFIPQGLGEATDKGWKLSFIKYLLQFKVVLGVMTCFI